MKNEFTIFFAIPFDSLTRATYEVLRARLTEHYKGKYALETVIGSQHVGPSQEYLNVLSFKAQNKDLHKQFFEDIQRAHVVIADLTNGNPNVHMELGIALAMNKNILRVTGRNVGEIGFDIRNMEAFEYKNQDQLFKKITDYLDVFFTIKKLPFEAEYKDLYTRTPHILLPGTAAEIELGKIWSSTYPMAIFRDGGIKIRAKFLQTINDLSWLGVLFRINNFDKSGYLLSIRKNGEVELALYPGPRIMEKQACLAAEVESEFDLLVDIQNDEFEVKLNNISLVFETRLALQSIGGVYPASFESLAEYKSIEIINRDTI